MAGRASTFLSAVAVLFAAGSAQGQSWSNVIHPEHRASVAEADARAAAVNASAEPQDQDARTTLAQVRDLLAAKALPATRDELTGAWRCRSVQIDKLGVFSYPFFRCSIRTGAGALLFEKSTGSQRRSGRLLPGEADTWVFLGGATVNDDPKVPYSALESPGTETRETDSAGVLRKIGDHHLLMILDAKPESYELYELKR